jgi:vanillate O-demethylase ferredoxin subunit
MAYDPTPRLALTVGAVTDEAERIKTFELVDPSGRALPAFAAGAHIDVEVPGGQVRQYSLSGNPADRSRYEIAVLDVDGGRGGSHAMHHQLRGGDTLRVSPPRNAFALDESAEYHLLLAGGIGITPIMSMVERLSTLDASYRLVYCTRSPAQTAFRTRLRELAGDRLLLHHDDGDPGLALDLDAVLAAPGAGTRLYYCGPPKMMSAVAAATADWPPGRVHFERFTNPDLAEASGVAAGESFRVELASTGRSVTVRAGETIVEALREAGVDVETSCEAGVCATCRTRYLHGEPDHRDLILSDEERTEYLTVCCSRSSTATIVLDL